MLRKKKSFVGISIIFLFLLNGCASYTASTLTDLTIVSTPSNQNSGIIVASKAFTKADCKKYLDRDVISKGYQPVQLYIQNNTDASYLFSPSRVSLPCARAEEVAEKVHTSTAGRAGGYTAAAVLTFGILLIPAAVDGVKSHNANESLDNDYACKVAKEQILFPHSHANMIMFVPRESYHDAFTITFINQKDQKPETITTMPVK